MRTISGASACASASARDIASACRTLDSTPYCLASVAIWPTALSPPARLAHQPRAARATGRRVGHADGQLVRQLDDRVDGVLLSFHVEAQRGPRQVAALAQGRREAEGH